MRMRGLKSGAVFIACLAPCAASGEGEAVASEAVEGTEGSFITPHTIPQSRQGAFDEAISTVFPMTPEMVRQYKSIHQQNEQAVREETAPLPMVDAVMVSLEPGEMPAELRLAPGIASAVGFFDAAGSPWPIRQFVIGNGDDYQVIQLGEGSGSLAIAPLVRVGWTNLIVALADEPTPVVLRIAVDREQAHFRRNVRILKLGPSSPLEAAQIVSELPRAGDKDMLAALAGLDLSAGAREVPIDGVDAQAWLVGDQLYVRSSHPLLSPAWKAMLAGPGGLRAYRLSPVSSLLFSVEGQVVLAGSVLP